MGCPFICLFVRKHKKNQELTVVFINIVVGKLFKDYSGCAPSVLGKKGAEKYFYVIPMLKFEDKIA